MNQAKGSLTTSLLFLFFHFCISIDTITPTQFIKDGDILVSKGERFALGFFSPGTSTRRYVGIWYNKVSEQTVVWVGNRDNPVNDASGVLTINSQGNLVLYEKNQTIPLWSTNFSTSTSNSMAQLQDSGNLVLLQRDTERFLWQSFDYPTDTLLPNMKLGLNTRTGKNWVLTSWKSKDDPGTGDIVYRIDPSGVPQLFLYKGSVRWWRGGPWTGERWSGVPEMTRNYIFNVSFVNNKGEVSIAYGLTNPSIVSRMMVNESGNVQRATWNQRDHRWIGFWSDTKEQCDNFGECGANSNCDPYDSDSFICKCLPGFEPKSPRDWYLRDGSGGCIRKAGVSTCQSGEGFVKMERVRVPDTTKAQADMNLSLKVCEQECLKNCSCTAYTSADERGFGCMRWYGDLVDTRTYSSVGQDIYVRVDAAELAKYGKSKGPLAKKGVQAIMIVSIIAVTLFLLAFSAYCFVRRKRKARDRRSKSLFNFTTSATYLEDSQSGKGSDEVGISDLPCFDLSTIAAATDNFSDANKLGEGGFGSVYKGLLYGEKEIAVKRLSKYSGQGNEEFKNEVTLIAKLQHRNLVRVLGYCIQEREKMLIYEFLPNKSLDSFIFDENKRSLLDWPTRHNIICGIARGILYLHQDSRLRIIHRDLKASNVLLDASMNPKISDFGMARIFGGDQVEANTNRVVGTYGYMSPEYAMQGLFSIKSDVYSFGVLLLEIITGRKNSSYYDESTSSNLVGYVWDLWREGRSLEMVDLSLGDSYPESECKNLRWIGLQCKSVVFMLSNDTILPSPKQPAFIMKRTYNSGDPSTSGANSVNEVTVTMLEPR
ncbi:hypothetical protein P3X46_020454 [Hevea brasiliensis]|uniref:Receptor-like serine/threonine-protein kinase n=1 Tax=Hevea brasiliensis TaxID=3981 RepID=A0ABQ9LLZ2_HEVBR|nr:hypothetical protein P3X46_020454 [Hevea brasiliensis]